jgi:hypothetical protein
MENITVDRSDQDKLMGEKSPDWRQEEERHYKGRDEIDKTQVEVLELLFERQALSPERVVPKKDS